MRITTEVTMKMHDPPHPGEVLKTLCLEPLNLTITDAARSLGVSRKTLSSILNGRAGISPEMAVRLSIAFDTSAESWLNQQVQYDLWHAERNRKRLRVAKLTAA
jgi:antitoxin HigA-1